jgi:3-dehydroquinate synthetase
MESKKSDNISQEQNNLENLQELNEQVLEEVTGGQLSKNQKAGLIGVGGGAVLGGAGYAAAHSEKAMKGLMGASALADIGSSAAIIGRLL